jgi:hypothetical protein
MERMNMANMDSDRLPVPHSTCIAHHPLSKNNNKLKMQERCDNSQNTWDNWWRWSKTYEETVARQVGGEYVLILFLLQLEYHN